MTPKLLDLRLDPSDPKLGDGLLGVARALAPGWADATQAEITRLTGGITNVLYELRAPGRPPLLVRIHGQNTEVLIDREAEIRLFGELSRVGFGPPLYGRFANGRVEGFLDGYRTLKPADLGRPGLRRLIARKLRELHELPLADGEPRLWSTLSAWMERARALSFEGAEAERYAALELERHAALLQRLRNHFTRELLPAARTPGARFATRAVLAHDDLLAGNIMYDDERHEVRFIDYEYAACSYAGFDVANHFCEYAGFDADFERDFPAAAVRHDFIAAYLGPGHVPEDIAAFDEVVTFFVVPAHLWWATWAVVQARYSSIDFDYLGYARSRLAGVRTSLTKSDTSFRPL
jgi:ethanolamine kinase